MQRLLSANRVTIFKDLFIFFFFQLIANKKGLHWPTIKKLADVQKALNADLDTMLAIVKEIIHEEAYTKEEICKELETCDGFLNETTLTPNTKDIKSFKMFQRATHVFSGKM